MEVLEIDERNDKIALSARSLGDRVEKAQFKDYVSGKGREVPAPLALWVSCSRTS